MSEAPGDPPPRARLPETGIRIGPCIICGHDAALVGTARLDAALLDKMSQQYVIGPMYPIAKEKYGYDEQSLYVCQSCGMVFVSPVLSDEDTTRLMFDALGATWQPDSGWSEPRIRREPLDPFYKTVRLPCLDQSLEGLLPKEPIQVLDVGGHSGELSINMALPFGSRVDVTQLENDDVWIDPSTRGVESIRTFNGLLYHFMGTFPGYRADLIIASNVLEHTDDPNAFLQDCRALLADDGLLVVDVPHEPADAAELAFNVNFQLAHHLYFFPWTFAHALERNGLEIVRFEVLPHAHAGVVPVPATQLRAICRRSEAPPSPLPDNAFAMSLDAVMGSFGASLALHGDADFLVFVYDPVTQPILEILRSAPGFQGVLTTNDALDYPRLLDEPQEFDARYVVVPRLVDRIQLRNHYHGRFEVV